MIDHARWTVFGFGMLIFTLSSLYNIYLMFIAPRRLKEGEYPPSPFPLVGGLMGAMGCLFAPHYGVKALFWLPVLLDPGTGLYLYGGMKSYREGMRKMNDCAHTAPEYRAAAGCLLGTAVADALGLAAEGLSRRRQQAMYPDIQNYHFFLGKGFCSDDTEHACMTANALIAARHAPEQFAKEFRSSLAWRLRFWLLALPAGVGLATGRGIIKLWLGFPADRAGVFSAGNGPAMRAPIIGALYGSDRAHLKELVRASTRLTHTDPCAEQTAFAVALAAQYAAAHIPFASAHFLSELEQAFGEEGKETIAAIAAAFASAERGETTEAFAESIGCGNGVSGYALHTVPVCLHTWRSHPDNFREAVLAVIRCGGDADTTAAIAGGIVGASVGRAGIPAQWLKDLKEWPRSVEWIERLGVAAAESTHPADEHGCYRAMNPPLFLPGILPRNILFLIVVLLHGFRRLLPPY